MLFLCLAILSSSAISVLMRFSAGKISAKLSMLSFNYLICAFLGAAYAGFDLLRPDISGFPPYCGFWLYQRYFLPWRLCSFPVEHRKERHCAQFCFYETGSIGAYASFGGAIPRVANIQSDLRLLHCDCCHCTYQFQRQQCRRPLPLAIACYAYPVRWL